MQAGTIRCDNIVSPPQVIISQVPIPDDFSTDPDYDGLTSNHSAAILSAGKVTLVQTQPLHVCSEGGAIVSQFVPPSDHLLSGDGIRGAHGGSGMSSIGGTLRVGELVPGGVIRHALKINLFVDNYLYYDETEETPGYRWPVIRADGYAADRYGGTIPQLKMGALLALLPDFDINSLNTEPAKISAQAFKDYGAYVVDDTAWDVYAITTEWGPDGRMIEEFEADWGFEFATNSTTSDWALDISTIFTNLQVVDNNSATSIGGGGTPVQPLALSFIENYCDPVSTNDELDHTLLNVFPNPARNVLHIVFPESVHQNVPYQLIDARGKIVRQFSKAASESRKEIDLSQLSSGVYWLRNSLATGGQGRPVVVY